MPEKKSFHLFEVYGVELEYMIVNRQDLSIRPITDSVIHAIMGKYVSDVEIGEIAWSNELVLHVIELKTNGPSPTLEQLPQFFQKDILKINNILEKYDACLLPSGAHPFMDPHKETCLWPHEYNAVYHAYNDIFGCQGHGWSNLQSTHLNLPFSGETEFVNLHTAIRLLLPIIPVLSASTPILDGKATGFLDTRLEYYRKNQELIPAITGQVIPEAISSIKEYHERILQPMYQSIAPYDKEGVLQEEWLNSRGAIARFDRDTIEIRVIDIQECAQADLAILALIVATLKCIMNATWLPLSEQLSFHETNLYSILSQCVTAGQGAVIENSKYLQAFGFPDQKCHAKELWQHILVQIKERNLLDPMWYPQLEFILKHGNLAERLLQAHGNDYSRKKINSVYQQLANCLANGYMFSP